MTRSYAPAIRPLLQEVADGRIRGLGSVAVREAIEETQPLLTLHGHIHESGGSVTIGRTTAINVGSEYGEGVLRGVLLIIGDGKLLRYQAVSG